MTDSSPGPAASPRVPSGMKLGFMQPYFLPYLGYFDLIRQTDEWVFFDSAQYIRRQGTQRGWVNRNRVLKQGGGWAYITVPVQHAPLHTPINRIILDNTQAWSARILAQFDVIRKAAPFHEPIRTILANAIGESFPSIAELNTRLISDCCSYLGIPFHARRVSELSFDSAMVEEPGDWALHLCKALGADCYLNPPGGRDLYDPVKFVDHGIRLEIQSFRPIIYATPGFEFVENLSILDVLAWNEPCTVLEHLDRQPKYFT